MQTLIYLIFIYAIATGIYGVLKTFNNIKKNNHYERRFIY